MEEKTFSVEQIKAVLSVLSMAVLSIQHFVGLLATTVSISYIPLSITFLTIFVGSLDKKENTWIKRISLIATGLIILSGCIIYTINIYGISMNTTLFSIYTKLMFLCIGVLSLILSILYVKRVRELEKK